MCQRGRYPLYCGKANTEDVFVKLRKGSVYFCQEKWTYLWGFPGGTVVKNPPANAGDAREWVRSLGQEDPGVGNDNQLKYSCLENSTDRGAWWAIVHRSKRVGHD